MSMNKTLLLVAEPNEINNDKLKNISNLQVVFTGIGPVNAAFWITNLEATGQIDRGTRIINVGFCGASSSFLKIGDIVAPSTASYIFNPMGEEIVEWKLPKSGNSHVHCYTGYQFYEGELIEFTSKLKQFGDSTIHDMELATYCQILSRVNLLDNLESYKIVSDESDIEQYTTANVTELADKLTNYIIGKL